MGRVPESQPETFMTDTNWHNDGISKHSKNETSHWILECSDTSWHRQTLSVGDDTIYSSWVSVKVVGQIAGN